MSHPLLSRVRAADALAALSLLVQLLLLWFCVVLVAPRVLLEVRDQGRTLPTLVEAGMRGAAWLLHMWWLPASIVVIAGVGLLARSRSDQRASRARLGLAWISTLATLLAAATAVATMLGLVAVWHR